MGDNEKILVSIMVETYNHEQYIRHTLESIISQKTNFKYEVVIVIGDDCSTDNNRTIILEYAEKYPDIIVPVLREKNIGMTGNCLDLIERTKGKYIAMVEGDDFWIDNNKLQKQVDFLESHPEYVACFGFCIIVDQNENRLESRERYSGFMKTKGDYTIKEFEDYLLPGQTATSIYRAKDLKSAINEAKQSELKLTYIIDRHLVLFAMSRGKLYNTGEYVSAYRYVLTSGSGTWSSENDTHSIKNLFNYLDLLKNLEKYGRILGVNINFDNRRIYEWDKLCEYKDTISKKVQKDIKRKLLFESNNKSNIIKVRVIRKLFRI